MDKLELVLLAVAVASGGFTGYVADEKGYSFGPWFAGGFFFSILALVAAVGLPDKAPSDPERRRVEGIERRCIQEHNARLRLKEKEDARRLRSEKIERQQVQKERWSIFKFDLSRLD
jgi:hypothetical protein